MSAVFPVDQLFKSFVAEELHLNEFFTEDLLLFIGLTPKKYTWKKNVFTVFNFQTMKAI